MKKVLAVLLCVVCLFSSLSVSSFALDRVFSQVITNISSFIGLEQDEPIGYGIKYDSNTLLSGVSVMYEPKPTIKLNNPGTYTVTSDTPLSIDYKFVCWQDKDTKKIYHAGDKIYVDGQKTLYAVWEPKTDNHNRAIRTILTALETLRRTFQAFFGVFKFEFVPDPATKLDTTNLFSLDGLVIEGHDYYKDPRTYEIGVEPVADGVVYESFSRTEPIYFGGSFETVEEEVVEKDENGKVINIYTKVVQKYTGAVKYSALYESTGEIREVAVTDEDGNTTTKKYQIIKVTLTDGVPTPQTGVYVTFSLPQGVLRYTDAGQLKANSAYAFVKFTTTNT